MKDVLIPLGLLIFIGLFVYAIIQTARKQRKAKAGVFNLVVRAASPSFAGKMMDDDILKRLADLAGKLPFRPEIQVRGNHLAAYLGDRNATVDNVETLQNLLDFARSVAAL